MLELFHVLHHCMHAWLQLGGAKPAKAVALWPFSGRERSAGGNLMAMRLGRKICTPVFVIELLLPDERGASI